MTGYILSIIKAREEDLIITILTENSVEKLYRFYGARHSIINLGYKINFTKEIDSPYHLPRIRDILHINYSWCFNYKILQIWQQFIILLEKHLRDISHLENFYLEILDETAKKLKKQNPKRAVIESYVKILEQEGRLHIDYKCLICEKTIDEDVTLLRSFLPAHKECSYSNSFNKRSLSNLFDMKKTTFFQDNEIEILWQLIMQGL